MSIKHDAEKSRFHNPILKEKIASFVEENGRGKFSFWDATAGNGGHLAFLKEKFPQGEFFASDTDPEIISLLQRDFPPESGVHLKQGNYSNAIWGARTFDYIFLDLGISSLHYDYFSRGFSYRYNEVLDMRLDTERGIPLHEWLARTQEEDIRNVLWKYGEIPQARKLARMISEHRKIKPILRTGELAEITRKALPPHPGKKHTSSHPEVKVFQAFRIHINQELEHLESAMASLPLLLNPKGRLMVISFHSLEDRIVKHSFLNLETIPSHDPLSRTAFIPGDFIRITRKPVYPEASEVEENPRSRSAVLRVLERK